MVGKELTKNHMNIVKRRLFNLLLNAIKTYSYKIRANQQVLIPVLHFVVYNKFMTVDVLQTNANGMLKNKLRALMRMRSKTSICRGKV